MNPERELGQDARCCDVEPCMKEYDVLFGAASDVTPLTEHVHAQSDQLYEGLQTTSAGRSRSISRLFVTGRRPRAKRKYLLFSEYRRRPSSFRRPVWPPDTRRSDEERTLRPQQTTGG